MATAIVGNVSSGGGSVPGELGAGTRAAEAPSQSCFAIWGQLIFSAESRRHLGCGDIAEAVAWLRMSDITLAPAVAALATPRHRLTAHSVSR